jgi:hypothetical protein
MTGMKPAGQERDLVSEGGSNPRTGATCAMQVFMFPMLLGSTQGWPPARVRAWRQVHEGVAVERVSVSVTLDSAASCAAWWRAGSGSACAPFRFCHMNLNKDCGGAGLPNCLPERGAIRVMPLQSAYATDAPL